MSPGPSAVYEQADGGAKGCQEGCGTAFNNGIAVKPATLNGRFASLNGMSPTAHTKNSAGDTAVAGGLQVSPRSENVVTFRVGGVNFEVLRQTISAKPDTLLCKLMSDPDRRDSQAHIYIEGDAQLFRYILSWYRYGCICLPSTLSMAEMRRECAHYLLPDNVRITRERMVETFVEPVERVSSEQQRADATFETARKKCKEAVQELLAASAYRTLVTDISCSRSREFRSELFPNPSQLRAEAVKWCELVDNPSSVIEHVKANAAAQGWEVTCARWNGSISSYCTATVKLAEEAAASDTVNA